jgi:predicted 3-demethylubiquinone-9 3-methyltransferase (glyoxalase superfamily)
MPTMTPCLWFDSQAEEAANFYVSIFKNSKVETVSRYSEQAANASGRAAGSVMTITFELDGQKYMALNGGPVFQFSPAISFMVNCESQGDIDHLWKELSAGGEFLDCGWLRDQYGITWQIVPAVLGKMMQDKDSAKTSRVMAELLKMKKLEIEPLQKAYAGK